MENPATDSLTEARRILSSNRTDKASRDLMTTVQRDALAGNYAEKLEFLTAAHFTTDADKRLEFERLFWESIKRRSN